MRIFLLFIMIGGLSISLTANVLFTQSGDSLNIVDDQERKQGYWIIYDASNSFKLEEGKFLDNRKTGLWKVYYPEGKIKSEIPYINGKPDGYAKIYYENGNLSEEGIWKGTKWVGEYKYYHPNGNTAYLWQYNETGKRTGEQKYFHENGKVMIEGNWDNGKEKGVIKEYYDDGTLKAEKSFIDGKMDSTNVKIYNKTGTVETNNVENNNHIIINNQNPDDPVGVFKGTGDHKTYNLINGEKKIDREGYWENGVLINGKRHAYDSTGKLIKTTVYQNGKITDILHFD
ncbi:MAG: toxin-antitoxin system YwqK family antitoxin [Bacteroidota bacterium]